MNDDPDMLEARLAEYGSPDPKAEASIHRARQNAYTVHDGAIIRSAWPSFIGMSATDVARAARAADPNDAVYEASHEWLIEAAPKLDRAATRDGLTGLLNRRGLEQRLGMFPAAQREHPATYVLIDLDHFKRANDEGINGHSTGDEVLVEVAHYLTNHLRPTDLISRFGGEEFIVVLPSTSIEDAAHVIDRLRDELPNTVGYQRRRSDGDTVRHDQTMSVGITPFVLSDDIAGALRGANDAADRALYGAKADGRNQTYLSIDGTILPYRS